MPTARRLMRSAVAAALAVPATGVVYAASAPPAHAASAYNGYCRTSAGVTVVVDFGPLGGGVATRCSPVGSGASGIDALQAAGIPVTGTQRYGLAFVCRLYGQPTASRELPGGYHEQCVNTPPTDAHWDYFKAANGGSWSYSSTGASGTTVIPGGFEGWRFSEGTRLAPRATPVRPAAPKPGPTATHTTTRPAPRRTTTRPAPHSTSAAAHDAGPVKGSTSAAHQHAHSPSSSVTKHRTDRATPKSTGPSSPSSSSTGAAAVAGGPPAANSDKLIRHSKQSSTVTPTTAVGGGVLAILAIGGTVVALVRRRTLG